MVPNLVNPWAALDAVGEGFVMTCIEEEARKMVEDSIVTATQVIEMLPVHMS
jgi:hypothetical protein